MPERPDPKGRTRYSRRELRLTLEKASSSTAADELVSLASHPSAEVRRAVAQNPNAPVEALDLLAEHLPSEVAQNPALSLLLLADPELSWLHFESALALCSCPDSPRWLLSLLADRGPQHFPARSRERMGWNMTLLFVRQRIADWWTALASNRCCPPEVLSSLMTCENNELRSLAASHPSAPRELLDLLLRAGSSPALDRVERKAEVTDEERLALMARGHWGRVLALRQPACPRSDREAAVRDALSDHLPYSGRRFSLDHTPLLCAELLLAVASNPSAEPDELVSVHEGMALVEREAVVWPLPVTTQLLVALAEHPSTPPSLLKALSCSPEPEVRAASSRNPALDQAWLAELLAAGAAPDLSGPAADPPPIAPERLMALAELEGFPRALVAGHPSIPEPLVKRFLAERDDAVRGALMRNPALGLARAAHLARQGPVALRRLLAEATWLPREAYASLARSKDALVLGRLRKNPACPRDLRGKR